MTSDPRLFVVQYSWIHVFVDFTVEINLLFAENLHICRFFVEHI